MNDFDLCIKKKEHKLYGAFGPKEHLGPMKKATKITFDWINFLDTACSVPLFIVPALSGARYGIKNECTTEFWWGPWHKCPCSIGPFLHSSRNYPPRKGPFSWYFTSSNIALPKVIVWHNDSNSCEYCLNSGLACPSDGQRCEFLNKGDRCLFYCWPQKNDFKPKNSAFEPKRGYFGQTGLWNGLPSG